MKIDLQKAYDSVEWAFMKDMMLATGQTRAQARRPIVSSLVHSVSGIPEIQLTHLCFADDLMLFCHGNRASIALLMKAFSYFSKATGLSMNMGKSNFYCNGVDGILDCHYLTEKIVARIRSLGSKKLSYAGRLVLIQSVLSTLHSYWARIFILPKTIIGKIESICRTYLWHGTDQKESPALVSWSQSSWHDYEPGVGSSWAWRKICQVKNIYKDYLFGTTQVGQYTLRQGYQWLKPDGDKVRWYPWMLNSWIIPRHTFLCWLVAQHRLLTQDRLFRMSIIQHNCCFLCGLEEETHEHLFFGCIYSKMCLQLVKDWCLCPLPDAECIKW
ncbi:uncharacterized protein LOC141618191 [Silene latifolia]|uniref:uncharacterized protein LOC141618191 n=1 Tax=Silene latifolia TaxID=37657 RepID=UPI003D77BBA3